MDAPKIDLMVTDDADPCVILNDDGQITDIATLLSSAPTLKNPEHATLLARAVNHLSQGFDFLLVEDPAAFVVAYNDAYDAEQDGAWQQDAPKLKDYGRQDLSGVAVPKIADDLLTFYVGAKFLGLGYKVTMSLSGGGQATYMPIPTS